MDQWRIEQKKSFNSLEEIANFLNLDEEKKNRLVVKKDFPLHIPFRIAKKMKKNCISNPLALQFLPLDYEFSEDGEADPVGDMESRKCDALLHKYQARALLLTTGACAMHCRYCFRQNFPYKSKISQALELIESDPSIKEVILSGGDPLSLSDKAIKEILISLEKISTVDIIRFHTRFIGAIPERITESFLEILKGSSKQIVFVLHFNSALELDEDIFDAISKLQRLKIAVLSQSVLLKGVNDSKDALYDLFWNLAKNGVIPYYLHQLDRVKGSLHLEVSAEKGLRLIEEVREILPGYAVPLFVKEIKGEKSKTPIVNLALMQKNYVE
jgi:EF-P beta-lysylation protein EpmB